MNIKETINSKINLQLNTQFLKIIDFSDQHKNHYDNGSRGDTSHITLIVVSKDFQNMSKINRERKIHKILENEIRDNLHSIRLKLYTPDEYD